MSLREHWVQERTTHLQRLRSHRMNWHPQFLRAAKDLNCDWALDLLERYPTADAFRKLTHAPTVNWAQGRRLRLVTVDRIAAAAYGPSPTTVPARHAAHAAEVRYRVGALRDLNTRLKE